MNSDKKQLLGIMLLLGFAAIVVAGTHYLMNGTNEGPFSWIVKYHFEFMVLIGLGGLAIGAFSFYLFGREVKEQKEITRKNTKVLLDFLDFDEKKIIEKLLEENGKARQYELTHLTQLSKVRAHRAIKKLASKGVVEVEKLGKVNTVKLKPEIQEGLTD